MEEPPGRPGDLPPCLPFGPERYGVPGPQRFLGARATYPHADGVRTTHGDTLTVFNIGGNKYRLIARIRYDYQLVNVRHVLTHAEYDAGKWKE
jgi:mRNA interferase HigB